MAVSNELSATTVRSASLETRESLSVMFLARELLRFRFVLDAALANNASRRKPRAADVTFLGPAILYDLHQHPQLVHRENF